MSLDIYYGFLLTEEDVINLFPNILDGYECLSEYLEDLEDHYLGLNISNELIIENTTDSSDDLKMIIGVKVTSAYGQFSSALIVPEVSLELKKIMEQFILDNDVFINMKPQVFAFMHV
jgi:hypothetical protein